MSNILAVLAFIILNALISTDATNKVGKNVILKSD